MKTTNRRAVWMGLISLIAVAGISTQLLADVTTVRRLKIKLPKKEGMIQARSTLQVQGLTSRRETDVMLSGNLPEEFQPARKTITLVSLDKKKVHHFAYPHQGFEEMSLSRWRKQIIEEDKTPWYISHTWSRVLPEQETRVIKGNKCSKFVYEWRFQLENPETYAKKMYAVKTTLWLTNISPSLQKMLAEESSYQKGYQEKMGGKTLEGLNRVIFEYAELLTGLNKQTLYEELTQGTSKMQKIQGYPMASRAEWFLVGYKDNKRLLTIDSDLEILSLSPIASTAFSPTIDFDAIADLPVVPSTPKLSSAK